MEAEKEKSKKHVVIPGGAVFCGILIVLFVFVFGFHKNWFPTAEKGEVASGNYVLEGTDSKIIVSENHTVRFENFDLNAAMKEKYHGYDLNAVYLGRDIGFSLRQYQGAIYQMRLDADGGELLELQYLPREEAICVRYADIGLEYVFEYA